MVGNGILVAVAALMWTTAAIAHHPFAEQFDTSKSVTLSGTVTKVDWANPHVYTYIDVRDAQGKMVSWKVEMGSPSALEKEGWSRTSVKTGDMVTIKGWAAKSAANLANADSFTLPDGKTIAAASSFHMTQEPESQLARGATQDPETVGTTGDTEALPGTASPLGLFAALGALSLAGALGLRAFRR